MAPRERVLRRKPDRLVSEPEGIYSILDEGLIAHIGFVDPESGEPTVIPVAYARDGDRILFHGSTGSRLFLTLKEGAPICATITLLDGIVVARSAFNSSMNYRSVMVFGSARVLEGEAKIQGLRAVSERLVPGLWEAGRRQTAKEFAQTMLAELSLDDVTAKERTGGPLDSEDSGLPIWAGVIPMTINLGEPITDHDSQHVDVPDYVRRHVEHHSA